jgi:hypothetical protein
MLLRVDEKLKEAVRYNTFVRVVRDIFKVLSLPLLEWTERRSRKTPGQDSICELSKEDGCVQSLVSRCSDNHLKVQ